jgi:hypothetical protein
MHAEWLPDGALGTVMGRYADMFREPPSGDAHDILVHFSTDVEGRDDVSWFAAAELQPAATRGDESDGEGDR